MKNYLTILFLLSLTLLFAQKRELKGEILNVIEEPQGGITIFNETTMDGTVTTAEGKFTLLVNEGDRILIQALQYTPFTLVVGAETLKNPEVTIQLKEGVNVLNEVQITNGLLLVDVEVVPDVNKTLAGASKATFSIPQIDRMENTFSDMVRQPEDYPVRQLAQEQSMLRMNCFNVLGLLAAIINEIVPLNFSLEKKREVVVERFDRAMLESSYSTEMLSEFLDIPNEELSKFMYYVSESGVPQKFMQPENEIELLQFLSEQAATYKKRQSLTLEMNTNK